MNLLIYLACQESVCLEGETSIRVEWSGVEPSIEDLISMWRDKNWSVVRKVRYSKQGNDITPVVVFVHPNSLDVPPTEQWDLFDTEETFEVAIEAMGKPSLQNSFKVLGQAPTIGTRLMNYSRTDHETLVEPTPRDWIVESFDEFIPQQSTTPFKAVYLSWCKNVSLGIAA